ncbi:unnamed protein product [Orchesella dallaii]|uniref:Uncharacterized protein n=1 Tax=Orchesella dallaii TaxID=48710 RepID=A0ABP1QTR8_9HEXA
MGLNKFFVPTLAVIFVGGYAKGLDMESAKEQPCFNISKTVPLDLNWVGTIKTLYYPLMSRLELYRVASDLVHQDPKDISEASVYYDSCFYWNMYTNGTIISRGYNGQTREYKTKLINGMEEFEFGPVEGMGYSGTVYTTLTDNSTFLFTPFCTDDGEMAWGLGSTLPILSEDTIKLVYEHAESLGFKREYFTELRYDKCDIETVDVSSNIADDDEIDSTTIGTTIKVPGSTSRFGNWKLKHRGGKL